MKLVMDEKLKHRLIGLSVVLSLGAIFVPAVMKKSSQHPENNFSVKVQLPPKPVAPHVVITDEQEMFKTIKVAKVTIPTVAEDKQAAELAKADYIEAVPVKNKAVALAKAPSEHATAQAIHLALNDAARKTVKKHIRLAENERVQQVQASKAKRVVLAKGKKGIYAVQLASFSQITNAQSLVNKLRSKGYKANYTKIAGKKGAIYKVCVGHSPDKQHVVKLKTQLASAMQLNGFVVSTGVS